MKGEDVTDAANSAIASKCTNSNASGDAVDLSVAFPEPDRDYEVSGPYRIKTGKAYIYPTGKGGQQLTNFTARITAHVVVEDGDATRRFHEVAAHLNGRVISFTVSAAELKASPGLLANSAVKPSLSPGRPGMSAPRSAVSADASPSSGWSSTPAGSVTTASRSSSTQASRSGPPIARSQPSFHRNSSLCHRSRWR